MGFWNWLSRRSKPLQPEHQWQVSISLGRLTVTRPDNQTESVPLGDLSAVTISTNDTGPVGMDLWFVAVGHGEEGGSFCAFPQGALGEQVAVDHFTSLPGFDFERFGSAMRSTDNNQFTVWRRDRRDRIVLEGPGWRVLDRQGQLLLDYTTGGHQDAWRWDEITSDELDRLRVNPSASAVTALMIAVQSRVEARGENPHISNRPVDY